MSEATLIKCISCMVPMPIVEIDPETGKCDHCRGISARTGLDHEGQPLGADAGVYVEELHAPGHALLDQRTFDGGRSLVECDEV